jgi:hypothetical protein
VKISMRDHKSMEVKAIERFAYRGIECFAYKQDGWYYVAEYHSGALFSDSSSLPVAIEYGKAGIDRFLNGREYSAAINWLASLDAIN